MALNIRLLAESMYKVYQEANISLQVNDLEKLKKQIINRSDKLSKYQLDIATLGCGREYLKFLTRISEINTEYIAFKEDFHDKLMIFIVGDGNVGKSTLLNAFVGYEAAKTSFTPLTWKIDVYDPSQKNDVLLRFKDGSRQLYSVEKALKFIAEEETRTSAARKKYNEELKKVKNKVKTQKELEEYKIYLGDKHLYVSDVTEARWPVKNNWILESCLLVDTPGMNQYVSDTRQIGDIIDYYHKADGIIWLMDGNTIASSNPFNALQALERSLSRVGGVRNNIIAVVNKIDLIEKNGGEESVRKILSQADEIYNNKFSRLTGISSKLAYEGITENNETLIKKSGIRSLTEAIKEVFIAESQEVKARAKNSNNEKLMHLVKMETTMFLGNLQKIKKKYRDVKEGYKVSDSTLMKNLECDMNEFMEIYLQRTRLQIKTNINSLAEGKGKDFILKEMYNIEEFENTWMAFVNNQRQNIANETFLWKEYSSISEYNYIKTNSSVPLTEMKSVELNETTLDEIKFFTPNIEPGIFSALGNLWGKAAFAFRKKSIIETIDNQITCTCHDMMNNAMIDYRALIDLAIRECIVILNRSFEEAYLPYEACSKIENITERFIKDFTENLITSATIVELLRGGTVNT